MTRCDGCPSPPYDRCRGESVRRLCELAADRPDYRRLLEGRPDPRPARPAGPSFARDPARVNVGFLVPVVELKGGAERVCRDIAAFADGAKLHFVGAAMPTQGDDVVAALVAASDVLITWGVKDWPGHMPASGRRPAVLATSHGDGTWATDSVSRADEADGLVGVGLACVPTFAPELRPRVRVIPNAVDPGRIVPRLDRAAQRAAWGVPADVTVALFLGRLNAEKRPRAAADAADLGRDVRVVLHGDGAERAGLEATPRPGVVLAGYATDVGSALAAADCLILPSETEGCSLAGLEAHAAGLAVIATPVGLYADRPDLVRLLPRAPDGPAIRSGVLADRADPSATRARAEAARRYVEAVHAPGPFGAAWTRVILDVAPPPPPPGPGTVLRGWLGWTGIKATAGCGCADLAARMDRDGCDWTLENVDMITRSMEAEAGRRGLPFVRVAARALVRRAVRVARRGGAR